MTAVIESLTRRKAWKALESHCQRSKELHLRKLFTADPRRESPSEQKLNHDSSTNNLIQLYRGWEKTL